MSAGVTIGQIGIVEQPEVPGQPVGQLHPHRSQGMARAEVVVPQGVIPHEGDAVAHARHAIHNHPARAQRSTRNPRSPVLRGPQCTVVLAWSGGQDQEQTGGMSDTIAAPESVLARATSDVPRADMHETAEDVRTRLTAEPHEWVCAVAVMDGAILAGTVAIEDLLPAGGLQTMADLMTPAITVHRDTDQEIAAWEMVRMGHRALAVVDDAGALLGIVTPAAMLEVLFVEHEEDLSRLAGVVHDTQQVRTATIESVRRRRCIASLAARGLAGAMLAAFVVAGYEDAISRQVILAFFLPGVVYMADAVGTQTETVVVRGLSVGVSVRQVAPKESLTGLIIGTLVAVLFVPLGILFFGDAQIMLAVGLALFVSCAVASVVAMVLPYVLSRLGRDPAYGSGPLATVIQDLLTILCYCAIVSTVV